MAGEFAPAPRNVYSSEKHFSLSNSRTNSYEEQSFGGSRRPHSRHAGIGRSATGVEARTQQRRSEEGGADGIFLPRPESARASAQRRRLPAGGRQNDAGCSGRRLGLFHRDP